MVSSKRVLLGGILGSGVLAGTLTYFLWWRPFQRRELLVERAAATHSELRRNVVEAVGEICPRPKLPTSMVLPPDDQWKENAMKYVLHLGVSIPCTDDDARWMLAVVRDHKDFATRAGMLPHLRSVFYQSWDDGLLPSRVSPSVMNDCLMEVARALGDENAVVRANALGMTTTARLWRIEPSMVDEALRLRSDPDPSIQALMRRALPEMEQWKKLHK